MKPSIKLNKALAQRVADKVNHDWGERVVTADDVKTVFATSTLSDREHIASRVLQELDECGYLPGVPDR